jgi:hypothetical protein
MPGDVVDERQSEVEALGCGSEHIYGCRRDFRPDPIAG